MDKEILAQAAGRFALVTGASSGIGQAYARALRERGWRVILVARRRDRLEALARELGEGDDIVARPADLTNAADIERIVADLVAEGQEVEMLVNCAGAGFPGRFHAQSIEEALGMVDLNVRAVVHLTRLIVPRMVSRGSGTIINVASTAALQPLPFMAIYGATKAFVTSFSEAVARELRGSGVQVQAVLPGPTDTEFFDVSRHPAGLRIMRAPRMSARQVVSTSLRRIETDRVIPGWTNRLQAVLIRFVPRGLVGAIAAALYDPGRAVETSPR